LCDVTAAGVFGGCELVTVLGVPGVVLICAAAAKENAVTANAITTSRIASRITVSRLRPYGNKTRETGNGGITTCAAAPYGLNFLGIAATSAGVIGVCVFTMQA
jgi:hypothetical protein